MTCKTRPRGTAICQTRIHSPDNTKRSNVQMSDAISAVHSIKGRIKYIVSPWIDPSMSKMQFLGIETYAHHNNGNEKPRVTGEAVHQMAVASYALCGNWNLRSKGDSISRNKACGLIYLIPPYSTHRNNNMLHIRYLLYRSTSLQANTWSLYI